MCSNKIIFDPDGKPISPGIVERMKNTALTHLRK